MKLPQGLAHTVSLLGCLALYAHTLTPSASAALIAYEAFEVGGTGNYNAGALVGQNPANSSYASVAWAAGSGGANGDRATGGTGPGGVFPAGDRGVVSTGLTQSGYETSGGSLRINTFLTTTNALGGATTASRSLATPATGISNGDFLWFSGFIQAPGTALPTGSTLMAGFHTATISGTGPRGMFVGFSGDELAVFGRGFSATAGSTGMDTTTFGTYTTGETYFFIARLGLNDGASAYGGNGSSNDTFELWLDPTDTSSLANLGTPDVGFSTFALGGANEITHFTALSITNGGETDAPDLRTAGFDDYRFGTTLSDVLPAIPEPGSLGLLASLAAFFFHRRRTAAA